MITLLTAPKEPYVIKTNERKREEAVCFESTNWRLDLPFTTWSLTTMEELSPIEAKKEQPNEMALHNKAPSKRFVYYLELAQVTWVHSPALFWASLGDAKDITDFDDYLAEFNKWASLQRAQVTEVPKLSSLIAVKLHGFRKRAKVMNVINEGDITVFVLIMAKQLSSTLIKFAVKNFCKNGSSSPKLYGASLLMPLMFTLVSGVKKLLTDLRSLLMQNI